MHTTHTRWRIEFFGGLRLIGPDRSVTRFRRQKTASLLAYLACHPDRPHLRDVLIELLWPESDPDAARHNLRESLSSLRHQLELPGTLRGTVLVADHAFVRLNGEAVSTDLSEFEEALASPSVTSPQSRKMGIHGPVGV